MGREVVRLAVESGHKVSVLSRHVPLAGSPQHDDGATYFAGDVTTGNGLAAAMAGADVVVDCLEGQFGKAQKQFADGGNYARGEELFSLPYPERWVTFFVPDTT
ncbi:SDR family oxidoreductase [Arthrobacter sp. MYb51]|uniref:SDR family oxidoreductase n=1 Tax=Arthrobacter sp. MYb51 TaxID=1848604 RepID=UPI002157AB3F|nr:SDR family oxidoreductase [Arthrobacter sp. MYb51]